jgi:exportin-1
VYEALGVIIESEMIPDARLRLLETLMCLPNASWTNIVQQANHSIELLWEPAAVTSIKSILRTNTRVARAMGPAFMVQLGRIYMEMLQVYKALSEFVSRQIAEQGVGITQTSLVRHMRGVKAEVCYWRPVQIPYKVR